MPHVTVTQVARHFAEYVNRVAYRRESFTRRPAAARCGAGGGRAS